MSLEYEARAIAVDSQDGQKVIVVRTKCHRTVRIHCNPNQADFVVLELKPIEEPCA
jgi:hypothetical protein